jgi:hypothetical protein
MDSPERPFVLRDNEFVVLARASYGFLNERSSGD